jgi:hypothetical protein
MTLESFTGSGPPLSLGGTATNASVEKELYDTGHGYNSSGNATISLNDSAVRTLANRSTSSITISFSDLYGKSGSTITVTGFDVLEDSGSGGYNAAASVLIVLTSSSTYYDATSNPVWSANLLGVIGTDISFNDEEYNMNPTPSSPSSWSVKFTIISTGTNYGVWGGINNDTAEGAWTNLGSFNELVYGTYGSSYVSGSTSYTTRGSSYMTFQLDFALTSDTSTILGSAQFTTTAKVITGTASYPLP